MRARPLVWITLAAALLCAVFAFVRMENLPKDPISGEMTAVIAQVSGDRLLLREVTVDGQPVRGGVMLYSEPCGCLMQEGMTIRMHTTLQPLEEETNPHGWSDKTWFAAKGVVYTCEGAVDAHSETAPYSLRGDLRSRMRSHIEELWPKEKEILTALLLGYDELLSDETMEVFRRSGAAHLLAVSGLHVGFVATLALMLFGWLRKGSVGRMLTVLACLGAYALVAESAFSVFRAVMMLAMVLCAQCCGRRADGATSLALAALAALAAEPMEIVRAGFLMSVCAVAGIFMLCSRIDRALEKILPVRWLRAGIAVSLSAQLGVLPVQAYLFGTVNVLSLLTNLFAVPLAGGIVMLGLPAVLLHMLLPAAAEGSFFLRDMV